MNISPEYLQVTSYFYETSAIIGFISMAFGIILIIWGALDKSLDGNTKVNLKLIQIKVSSGVVLFIFGALLLLLAQYLLGFGLREFP